MIGLFLFILNANKRSDNKQQYVHKIEQQLILNIMGTIYISNRKKHKDIKLHIREHILKLQRIQHKNSEDIDSLKNH